MVVSYFTQRLQNGVIILLAGLILSIILCVPAWPFYKKNGFKWLPYKESHKEKID